MDAKYTIVPPRERAEETLLDKFDTYFELITVCTQEQIQQAQRIRYQVYCVENPFENTDEYPDGLECDEFDSHAVHSLLIH